MMQSNLESTMDTEKMAAVAGVNSKRQRHHHDDVFSSSSGRNSSGGPSASDIDGEDENMFDDDGDGGGSRGSRSSRTTSFHRSSEDDDEIISEMPEEENDIAWARPTCYATTANPVNPTTPSSKQQHHKSSSPFRHPSSVRAMQMDTTPPSFSPSQSHSPRPSSTSSFNPPHSHNQLYRRPSNMSRHSTPRSIHHHLLTPSSNKAKKLKKEYPLVLLHVTLLPLNPPPYSLEIMTAVLPSSVMESYNLLKEKINDDEMVLERGILLPHPKEDYELLEERILESLELGAPRILKCGHFIYDRIEDDHGDDGGVVEKSNAEEITDEREQGSDICVDCGRKIEKVGVVGGDEKRGGRRWTIKVYASNGLMRAGAWAAAWKEMERVDVEIEPWIPDDLRREMEIRREEEEETREALRREKGEERSNQYSAVEDEKEVGDEKEAEEQRMREIYGVNAEDYIRRGVTEEDEDDLLDRTANDPHSKLTSSPLRSSSTRRRRQRQETDVVIPLSTLLKNYILQLASDKKNITIGILGLLATCLLLSRGSSTSPAKVDALERLAPEEMVVCAATPLAEPHVDWEIGHGEADPSSDVIIMSEDVFDSVPFPSDAREGGENKEGVELKS